MFELTSEHLFLHVIQARVRFSDDLRWLAKAKAHYSSLRTTNGTEDPFSFSAFSRLLRKVTHRTRSDQVHRWVAQVAM